jgi:hypothetical protein
MARRRAEGGSVDPVEARQRRQQLLFAGPYGFNRKPRSAASQPLAGVIQTRLRAYSLHIMPFCQTLRARIYESVTWQAAEELYILMIMVC